MRPAVRPATPDDAGAVRRLALGFGGRSPQPDDATYARRYGEMVTDPAWLILIATDGDIAIGYALVQDFGPGLRSTFTVGRMHDLYVETRHRRQGAARALMAAVEDWSRSRPSPMVLDWQASATGIAFYEALWYQADYEGDNSSYPGFCLDLREPSQS